MWLRVKGLFLPIFAIILCIYPLYTSAQGTIFSYNEKNNNGRALRVYRAKKFDDGTVIVRIIKDDANSPSCYYDTLSFRIIHPDGTVDERDIGLNILGLEQFNYCRPEGDIDYQIIRKDQILVTFYRPSDGITFEQWGVVIGFDGKEISRASLGNTVGPISKVTLNSNKENGFLKLASMRNTDGTSVTTWVQYKIEKNGAFTKLTDGVFNFDYFLNPNTSTVISTVGEGYAVIYANMKTNGYVASNPLLSQGILYALTIGYNQTTVSPLLLYQTPLPNLSFRALSCDISYSGVGQVCTLTVSLVGATGAPTRNFYVKVNFLSSGSVTSSKVITRTIPNDVPSIVWRVDVLPFGGFMFSNFVRGAQDSTITGFLFGDEDPTAYNWGLPVPEPINSDGVYLILPNNSLLVFQKETFNSWRFEKVDLLRFDVKKIDNGYSNINILSTSPRIGDSIYENATTTITITFYNPVELSDGNLLIIQEDNNSLRQIIPGTKCSLDVNSNDTMVIVNVLISTFSIPNGNYFVMMESNFVKDKAYKEPLLGIREHVWHFATENEKVAQTSSRSGLFRLTVDGTKYYDGLDRVGRRNFFSNLKNQVAVAVPIDASRLVTIEKVQVDRSVNDKQYLLSIGVKDTKKDDEINVATVIDYINTMVTNKDQTQIGLGDTTHYLDETYGFNRVLNIWERYYRVLSVLFVLVILLFASFLSAQIKTKNNEDKENIKNVAILQLGLIIFDLVMDILFVSSSSRDFQELYIPSVVFVTLPIAINTILAFYIITQENSSNQKFYQWFIKNGKIASVFTVLAGADIEALNILHSNLLGVELFRAPFEKRAKDIITRGGYLNIFTEDIPQVIIQIVYYKKAVSYGLIPLLTFISSVLTLAINLSSILYEQIQKNQDQKTKTDRSNNAN